MKNFVKELVRRGYFTRNDGENRERHDRFNHDSNKFHLKFDIGTVSRDLRIESSMDWLIHCDGMMKYLRILE
jgi:hypothetical protein